MKPNKTFTALVLSALMSNLFISCDEKEQLTKETINFQNLVMEPNSFWNGSDESGSLTIGLATFNNSFDPTWDYWEGFAISNKMDMTSSGWGNQYSAFVLDGGNYQNIYAVSYVWDLSSTITFSQPVNPISIKITNSTWAYLSMLNGDAYCKKFEHGDWFKITIKGYDSGNQEKGSVDFYLADFRSTPHYIINTWTNVDLSSISNVNKIVFYLSSTDNGDWGMNTPAYFCIDDFTIEYQD